MTKNALLKRGPKYSGMGRPPPSFGQCPKENVFFPLTPSLSRFVDLQLLDLTRSSNVDLLDEVVDDCKGKDHSYEEGHGEHYREDGPRNIQAGNNSSKR